MSPTEKAIWITTYAASYVRNVEHTQPEAAARRAAIQANEALAMLKRLAEAGDGAWSAQAASEVLKP